MGAAPPTLETVVPDFLLVGAASLQKTTMDGARKR